MLLKVEIVSAYLDVLDCGRLKSKKSEIEGCPLGFVAVDHLA